MLLDPKHMSYEEWQILCLLLAKASDKCVELNEDGEEDDDAGTFASALDIAQQYRNESKAV